MIAESPFALIGTTASIAETLVQRREELGFSYVIVGGEDIEPFAPVVAAARRHLTRPTRVLEVIRVWEARCRGLETLR